ncbi:MAG: putative zinc-binding protein [Planctomycetota bacterium]
MSEENSHLCNSSHVLIFACSGAADVGAISDRAARTMTQQGVGKMFCLAGIGGRANGIMKTAESADRLLAIDGCPMNCAKRCLEQAGFNTFAHLQVADLGLKKGESPVRSENIWKVVLKAREILD